MMIFLMFVLGVIAGSVANAVIYRVPRGVSWYKGRSFCPNCKHALSSCDLLPIASYLLLRGKCRYCQSPIPVRYLLVELFLGVGFVLSPLSNLGILWVSTVIAVMDWETMLVSDWMVLIWGGLVVVSSGIGGISGGLVGMGVIGGLWLITNKKAMGSGDIGIAAVLGLWLGFPKIITALWVAFVIGGIYGGYLLITKKAKLKTAVPFGPFLILGGWIAYTLSYGVF
ncbi:MAG: prepilin peptidase [Patescibacteria group bacterium]